MVMFSMLVLLTFSSSKGISIFSGLLYSLSC
ncbi:hypothetical protein CPS_3152 [Colwellia psychrerythraea 34H]|uniref:Uncharacterized protein n=1 Tax=Colwellia psychrerythraea (strain 34H / ATCC BAA-681) TaxID=167879 RepID=Q47ZC1_COLP3|nr:hypothetical protein CPS_3152 [Colwellia psychrerythraea 34H]